MDEAQLLSHILALHEKLDHITNLLMKKPKPKKTDNKAQAFIGGYCDRFWAMYGLDASIKGKNAGIAKRVADMIPADRLDMYLDAFFTMPDPYYEKVKHPLAVFENRFNEIAVYAERSAEKKASQLEMASRALEKARADEG